MVLDVVRGYLQVAGGLTDISVQRAREVADALLSRGSDAAERSSEQIGALAEDLVKQSQTNRDILIGVIRTEVDRTVGRMGFVREEELAAVRNHVQRLEAQLKALQSGATGAGTTAARTAGEAAARTISGAADMATKVVPVGKRAESAGDSPAEQAAVEQTVQAPAPATAAEKAPAKRASARKSPAKTASAAPRADKPAATTKRAAAKRTAPAVDPAPVQETAAGPDA